MLFFRWWKQETEISWSTIFTLLEDGVQIWWVSVISWCAKRSYRDNSISRRTPKFWKDKILLNYLEVPSRGKQNKLSQKWTSLRYGRGKEYRLSWVCMVNKHDLITIDSQGCLLTFFLIRLVPLSFMKMKKMTLLQAVSKKLATAGLSGTESLVTSPEHILGKLHCSSSRLML